MTGRRSVGGQVVESGLAASGFDIDDPAIALVETRLPGRRPFDVVLAQSAWNVIPGSEFRARAAAYPPRMRQRMWARRAVAAVNLRRARRVLCLTEAHAAQVRRTVGREVEVSPVWLPLDLLDLMPAPVGEPARQALVPGTLTWFKEPAAALDVAAARGIGEVLFAGRDDGSGCWDDLVGKAAVTGMSVSRRVLSRQELCDAMASSAAVVVPSGLESLGFAVAEALTLTTRVVASPLPSHVEVARRLGAEPRWLPDAGATWPRADPAPVDREAVRGSWQALGEALGLRPERLR